MPEHIKMILRQAALGGVISAVFVGGLLWFNVVNLWHLVTHTSGGMLALGVFFMLCWITFGSVQIGIRIMMMGEDDDKGGGRRAPEPVFDHAAIPIPVRVDESRGPMHRGPGRG